MKHLQLVPVIIVMGLMLMPDSNLLAQTQKATTYEDNARKFAFGQINFSMTLAEFKNRFPTANDLTRETNEKIDFYRYDLSNDPQNVASAVTVWFYDGKLLDICIQYNNIGKRRLDKVGGAVVLLRRLEAKFGTYNVLNYSHDKVKDEARIWWSMPKSEMSITLRDAPTFATINVSDTGLLRRLNDRKAKDADIGF